MRKLILQHKKECFFCGTTENLHHHEVFFGSANRKKSIEWGCQVWLCGPHHNLSSNSVHLNHEMDMKLKRYTQMCFESVYGHKEFMRIFHKNYLGDKQ